MRSVRYTGGRPGGSPSTGTRSRRCVTRKPARTGDWRCACCPITGWDLWLDGASATAHELLVRFPPHVVVAEAELTALTVADELQRGSLEQAERQLLLAARLSESATEERRVRVQTMLAGLRLRLARQRGDLAAVVDEAQRLLGPAELPDATWGGLDEDVRAVWLLNLSIAEAWTAAVSRCGATPGTGARPGTADATTVHHDRMPREPSIARELRLVASGIRAGHGGRPAGGRPRLGG